MSSSKRVQEKVLRRRRTHKRIRNRLRGSEDRPRLAVYRSLRYIYAQLIDDGAGVTLAQASSRESDVLQGVESSSASIAAARSVGAALAERALEKGIKTVVFDRGGFLFHGRVKALAEGAREKGLQF